MKAHYWIAQYLPDLFRNEPRNVGVIAQVGPTVVARFVGEMPDLQVDGRKIKGFRYPGVYRQWVGYWRSRLSAVSPDALKQESGHHYRVVDGGLATDVEPDSPEEVVNYLYALLVSDGGFLEAIKTEDERVETIERQPLQSDIEAAFRDAQILTDTDDLLTPPHPIRRGVRLRGASGVYTPAFVQRNGRCFVMESIDFTGRLAQRSRDHAGWSAYMFKDLRSEQQDIEAIAIVQVSEDNLNDEAVQNGYDLIEKEANCIVHWDDTDQRQSFLEERRKVALSQ